MYQAIVFGTATILCVLIVLLFRKLDDKKSNLILKGLTIAFCAVGIGRFFLSDGFLLVINGAWEYVMEGNERVPHYFDNPDIWHSILRWGYYTSYVVFPMAVFYKSRFFRNVASYFSLLFVILSAIFFNDYMEYFLSPIGKGFHVIAEFRYFYFILELVLGLMVPVLMQVKYKHYLNVKDWKEVLLFVLGLIPLLVIMAPSYIPQSFMGYGIHAPEWFGTFHLGWIGVTVAVTVVLYYVFRFRSHHDRYMLVMFLTLLLFFHYFSLYLTGVTIKRLPFHLCNLAGYLFFVAMVFKIDSMIQFCCIVNLMGTIVAFLGPDFDIGYFSFGNVHFCMQHSLVLMIPALVLGLRITPRLSPKSLKYAAIYYSAYFLFVFVFGTIINGFSDVTGERVNYFYIFDQEVAFSYAPFLAATANTVIHFGRFMISPVIIAIVYFGFFLLCFLLYLLIRFLYKVEDDRLALRLSGIELYEKTTHKTSRRPKHYVE